MNPSLTVAVVIPVLNGERTIADLLGALRHQAGVGRFEVVVVDNGSTDRTLEIARSFGATVLEQPVRGPSAARNLGLRHVHTDIVAFADSDTVPPRRWLAAMLAPFTDPQEVIVTGPVLGWKPATAAERFASARRAYTREMTADHPTLPYAVGMNLAVRRECALAIGGFDDAMTSGEDLDFSYRLRMKFGNRIGFNEQALLFHQHRCSDDALQRQARWHGAGMALFQQRHPESTTWTWWHGIAVSLNMICLTLTAPVVAFARRARLVTADRAEFETYHRLWSRCYWAGFFEQQKKKTP